MNFYSLARQTTISYVFLVVCAMHIVNHHTSLIVMPENVFFLATLILTNPPARKQIFINYKKKSTKAHKEKIETYQT